MFGCAYCFSSIHRLIFMVLKMGNISSTEVVIQEMGQCLYDQQGWENKTISLELAKLLGVVSKCCIIHKIHLKLFLTFLSKYNKTLISNKKITFTLC